MLRLTDFDPNSFYKVIYLRFYINFLMTSFYLNKVQLTTVNEQNNLFIFIFLIHSRQNTTWVFEISNYLSFLKVCLLSISCTEKLFISIFTIVFFNLEKNESLWEFLLVKILNFIIMICNFSINYSKICYELCWSFILLL